MKEIKKKVKNSKGITLIALIITIIILLILAGIAIQALTNTGLFARAKEANIETRGASVQEARDLWKMNQELDNYGESGTAETLEELLDDLEKQKLITSEERTKIDETGEVTIGSKTIVFKEKTIADYIKIGDYVAYTPDTASTDSILEELGTYSGSTANTTDTLTQESGLNWRVLDIVEGKVRLISELPTTSTVTLAGAKGYNNAVYLLDKTCSTLYNNSTYAEKVQSLKIEDIQDYLTYDYTQYENPYVDTGKYGGTQIYTIYRYYPNIFAKEKTGWVDEIQGTELDLSEQTSPIDETSTQAGTSIKVTQTYWVKTMVETDFTDSIYYNLFINNGSNYSTYWMSSRCVDAYSSCANFYIRIVYSRNVFAKILYGSDDASYGYAYALRPVITLKSDVQIDTTDTTKDGTTATNAYVLK